MNETELFPINSNGTLDLENWRPRVYLDDKLSEKFIVSAKHDARMGLIFELLSEAHGIEDFLRTSHTENPVKQLEFGASKARHTLLAVSRKSCALDNNIRETCILTLQPLSVELTEQTTAVKGNIININPKILRGGVEFETETAKVKLHPIENAEKAYEAANRLNENLAITGVFEIEPKSLDYGLDEINNDVSIVWQFLRFTTGTDVGLGPWVATSLDGRWSAIQPDAGRHDPLTGTDNWSNFYSAKFLPLVFNQYQAACGNSDTKDAFKRAVDFYRASTSARNSTGIETGIVLAQSALELLSDFILQKDAGWTAELTSQARGFHNRLAASSKFIGYRGDILEYATSVKKAYRKRNLLNDFHILTNARNSISHAKPDVELDGEQLLGIWNASMFLVELHLFFLIGYHDEMRDRRVLDAYFGQTVKVPLRLRD